MAVEWLEKPLPKPRSDLLGYASARALEALLEAFLALRFLEEGFTRNAAGKAFQAWRALTGALLVLEKGKVVELLREPEQKKWFTEKALPRIPSSRLKQLGQLIERAGVRYYSSLTDKALDLHDYQYHGPDPDMALSKYRTREEAATAVRELASAVAEYAKRLKTRVAWGEEHEEALRALEESLGAGPQR